MGDKEGVPRCATCLHYQREKRWCGLNGIAKKGNCKGCVEYRLRPIANRNKPGHHDGKLIQMEVRDHPCLKCGVKSFERPVGSYYWTCSKCRDSNKKYSGQMEECQVHWR